MLMFISLENRLKHHFIDIKVALFEYKYSIVSKQ